MTSPRYLLDTNILTELVRDPRGPVTDAIRQRGEGTVCTSCIVEAELRYGAAKSGSAKLADAVAAILDRIERLAFDTPAAAQYARLRLDLEQGGRPIGPNDLLIAAQAMASDLVVVTANDREFARVRGLRVENWLRPKRRPRQRPRKPR